MASKKKKILLDPEALQAYHASLLEQNFSPDEIHAAKREYILGAIANFQNVRSATRTLLVVLAVASLMPVFLLIFIPAFIGFRNVNKSTHTRIIAAINTWKNDLGNDYADLLQKAQDA
ncbi:MAG: hypothetical protein ABI615_01945 [Chthoniobacterales bacterium]